MASVIAITATSLAVAAYLDGKYQLGRDLNVLRKTKRSERSYARAVKEDRVSPFYLMEQACLRCPDACAIWTRERSWTFKELYDQVARYAQWLLDEGVRSGDLVGLYLHNSADFVFIFFATHCIGAGPALVNHNLEGKALLHCLAIADTKLLIVDHDEACQARISGSRDEIETAGTGIVILDEKLKHDLMSRPVSVPDRKWRDGMRGSQPYCLLYTSGTTGLPKGCPWTVTRTYLLGWHLEPPYGCVPDADRWYCPMPMYHGTGAITTTGALISGIGVAIAPRFSVSRFWNDIHDSEATLFMYVGETARYLLKTPKHPLERDHKLRIAYGNGLRPDIWKKFQDRFNIPEIAEFFNSSEGLFSTGVWDKGDYLQGCVGHHGLIFRQLYKNFYIPVRIDYETGDIWRDPKTGYAQRVPFEEGGEVLVAVPEKAAFCGYWNNQSATEKKFATNVFKEGDLYYRSGDAIRRSRDGHFYFMDRLGDTFRWKSENVSTAEVAEALGRYQDIAEANVYGVLVPNHDGRAGCAAIDVDGSGLVDYADLVKHVRAQLPKYAVPQFIRVVKASSHTHNHKQNKVSLRKEGVDPALIGSEGKAGEEDVILWLSPTNNQKYVPFTQDDWDGLSRGSVRL